MKPFSLEKKFVGKDKKVLFLNPDNVFYMINEGDVFSTYEGDYVYRGQLLKTSKNGDKTFSSISGYAYFRMNVLIIANDFKEVNDGKKDALVSIEHLKKDDITKKLLEYRILCNDKLLSEEIVRDYKSFIVNMNDVYFNSFNNKYLIIDYVLDFFNTIDLIRKEYKFNAYVFVPRGDKILYDVVTSVVGSYPNIRAIFVNDDYPYNKTSFLVDKYLKRVNMEDVLELDVLNVVKIFSILKRDMPLLEKYITICGDDINSCFSIKVKYGVSLSEVLKIFVGENYLDYDYYINNVMERILCKNIGYISIDDSIDNIYVSLKKNILSSSCIRCGLCNKVCPVKIKPMVSLDGCIKCGLCNYICPSNINLLNKEENNE